MKGNLTSNNFNKLSAKVIELGKNAKDQTISVVSGTKDVQKYLKEIEAANDKETNDLNELLISALDKINYTVDCVHSKLSIIYTLKLSCALGYNNMDRLYTDATDAEKKKVVKSCIENNYMAEAEIKSITKKNMLSLKKQGRCVRNNKDKQDSVCLHWYLDIQHSVIARKFNVTFADVEHFIKSCPPGNIVNDQKAAICSKKEEFFSLSNVSELYWKLNRTQVQKAYDACPLSRSQKDDICTRKHDMVSVEQVQAKYFNYATKTVSSAFNSCQTFADLNEATYDRKMICNLQRVSEFKYGKPAGETFWDNFKKKYGRTQIEDIIATCVLPSGYSAVPNTVV